MPDELSWIREMVTGLRKDFDSFLKSYNSNHSDLLQRATGSESWQSSHERLDDERWRHLEKTLSELKGMLETLPVKMQEDLGHVESAQAATLATVTDHEETLQQMKGAWKVLAIGGALITILIAVAEYVLHWKK